jgi:hypothetical protein
VHHRVEPTTPQRRTQALTIQEICVDEVPRHDRVAVARREVVERRHLEAALCEVLHGVRADVAGSADDQDAAAQEAAPRVRIASERFTTVGW